MAPHLTLLEPDCHYFYRSALRGLNVRIFSRPKSLGETLAQPTTLSPRPTEPTGVSPTNGVIGYKITGTDGRPHPWVSTTKSPRAGVTFAHQDDLPHLPIPELSETTEKYLAALKPLQNAREHGETKAAVAEFLKQDGVELQEKLKRYAESKTSYIEQFCKNNQITRAASLVASSLEFVRAVRREELPPDTIKGTPLCMYQFSRLFGTARVPTENGCQIVQDPESKHIVVLCHGQFYYFDVLDDNSDVIMTEKDISINLQTIIEDAAQTGIQDAAKGALGVLSTENRKIWSGLRDVLTREEGSNNADGLAIVDSALFVLCLDYTEPADVDALCGNMLCGTSEVEKGVQIGTCTNRWYDKLQIIVCKNGSAGINFEHTGVDGHTVLRFASDVYTDTILRFARTINGQAPTLWATTSPDPSKRDPSSFGDHYGKNFITSTGFSPDAFVQMAFQAAYYGLYGRVECTYEPAMTKTFLHGRTEAIRSVSAESINFVQTFWADNPAEQKVEALRKACQKHTANTRECAKAQGCDRHLYALFCVWQKLVDEEMGGGLSSNGYNSSIDGYSERDPGSAVGSPGRDSVLSQQDANDISPFPGRRQRGDSTNSRSRDLNPLPLLFADPGWDKLNNTILSTSNCGNPSLRHFGFGPTSGDGFGIGYIIKDEGISICISSKHRQTKRFVDTLESYLLEMRRVLRITTRRGTGPSSGGAKQTRARELEDTERPKPPATHRMKSRGRIITGLDALKPSFARSSTVGTMSPTEESVAMSDDELGGYGFFDAGMLLQALKARGEGYDGGETKPSERAAVQARRRDVGKKLRLSDY
ncbi:carnitine O-palmitoyltransferase I [Verticillium dahliae VdLs.17]|uniref:Carnitine O-palmitoyltransferase I n=1 Tax=Verticillium dahliae (strain VdLs.17 / ATCC MYA-4575 / FGSC 10137) TaxID=498257 RepID=G2X9X1_VERDV|nr:carnitine O-palmitoyltransferase I [Verticillium dahliae VdLs.17]EGY16002.1 carnitine O-palmitoyltransferase I [Verticillium dahliae VdLs.17]